MVLLASWAGGVRMLVRLISAAIVFAWAFVLIPWQSGSATVEAQTPEDFDIPNGHFYTQGRGSYPPGYGFAVVDDGIQFWTSMRQLGGPPVVGFPISQRYVQNGQVMQSFQKLTFTWRTDNGSVAITPTSQSMQIPSEALVP